ncbi:MAG: hypothetical protein JKY15_05330, partial [Deltaproteobacteria bacterium]|nr:hypothetical protein [Deltaproteobacteria bacterium]
MIQKIFVMGAFLLSTLAIAAVPPMSDSQRERRATHIVEGEVMSVESTVVDQGTNGRFQNRVFTAKIRVHKFVRA